MLFAQITYRESLRAIESSLNSQRTKLNRLKSNKNIRSESAEGETIIFDQIVSFTTKKAKKSYPQKLRRIKYKFKEKDSDKVKSLTFLTNNFELEALTVARLYKKIWQIELFFKWIKQHLKIKTFYSYSENGVKVQIWTAICTYLLIAIMKKELKIKHSLYEILQILSVNIFERMPLDQLFGDPNYTNAEDDNAQPLLL